MYKLFLTLRYLRKRRIAYFAIAAVTLCVAMVMIVMSVMGGFLDMIKARARGLLGDIVIDNARYQGFPLYDEFIAEVSRWPEVVRATPVIYSPSLLRFPTTNATTLVFVVGLRLDDVYVVNGFKRGLFYEKHYPGTTTLLPQRQPVAALDPTSGEVRLPPPYAQALAASRAAGVVDDETYPNALDELLIESGRTPIPGVLELDPRLETPELRGEEWPGLIIGRDILAQRQPDGRYLRLTVYPRGYVATLTLWPTGISGNVDPIPIKQPFRYADDSRTGIYEIDSKHVYCEFELLQKLLGWNAAERTDGSGVAPGRCSQIQVKIAPGFEPQSVAERLERALRAMASRPEFRLDPRERDLLLTVEAKTWEKSQEHIILPVEKERILVSILFGIISLVAIVLVLCILYMIALQKTRDIGIVKSIGGSSFGVAGVFLMYGAAVGLVGGALGTTLGVTFVTYINEFQALLIRLNPAWQVWDRSVYSFDAIPNTVRAADAVLVFVVAVLTSTLGAFAAAWRAGAMHPVEALRYE